MAAAAGMTVGRRGGSGTLGGGLMARRQVEGNHLGLAAKMIASISATPTGDSDDIPSPGLRRGAFGRHSSGSRDVEHALRMKFAELEAFIQKEFLPRGATAVDRLPSVEDTMTSERSLTGFQTTRHAPTEAAKTGSTNPSVRFLDVKDDGCCVDIDADTPRDDQAVKTDVLSLPARSVNSNFEPAVIREEGEDARQRFSMQTSQGASQATLSAGDATPRNSANGKTTKLVGSQRRQKFLREIVGIYSKTEVQGAAQLAKRSGYLAANLFTTVAIDSFFSFVIVLNAVTIGVSADVDPTSVMWVVIDTIFALLFLLEMGIKVYMQKFEYLTGPDRFWNLFEALMVAFGLFESIIATMALTGQKSAGGSSNLALLRILRLARISRLMRVCRIPIFVELKIMIQGAFGGCRTLLWSTVLICLPLYAAAIFYRETLGVHHYRGEGAEMFSSVPLAFFTLFRCTVSNECSDPAGRPIFLLIAKEYGWIFSFSFCTLELFMVFGLFNVIVAIFIENVLAGAKTNDLVLQRERLRNKMFFAQKMMDFLAEVVKAKNESPWDFTSANEPLGASSMDPVPSAMSIDALHMQLTPDMLDKVFKRPAVAEIIRDLDLAEADLVNIFEILDIDGSGTIDMAELFEGISRLRGNPSRSDVVGLSFMMEQVIEELNAQHEDIHDLRIATLSLLQNTERQIHTVVDSEEPSRDI